METTIDTSYIQTLKEIKERIYEARYQAITAVNKELIKLYSSIGEVICKRQEREAWGKSTVERLAKDLQVEFEGIRGFSAPNLWNMRHYYLAYKDREILQTLSREIGWSHNIEVLNRCKDDLEREFYLRMTARYGWSVRTLQEKIVAGEYQRWALKQNNFTEKLVPSLARKAEVLDKDDYNLDFLLLGEEHKERELEDSIIRNINKFLREVGEDLLYAGNQVRLDMGDHTYYIDLLFYHRVLKCHIIIELKTGEFKPEYTGKMGAYLAAFEDLKMREGENPPIGIILCKSKNRAVVEYSLKTLNRPVGVATYNAYRNVDELPPEAGKYLPSPEEITSRLGGIIKE